MAIRIYEVSDNDGNPMYNPDGRRMVMNCPPTKAEAIRDGYVAYYKVAICPRHSGGRLAPLRTYVKSDIFGCCLHQQAVDEHRAALRAGEPTNSDEAVAQGKDYYWDSAAFSSCGHTGKCTLKGKCYECRTARANSPRQMAIRNNQEWYMPDEEDPCANGHIAPRRVNNGSCKQCEENRKKGGELPIHKQFPDMVISCADAKTLGFISYRTGKPCRYGHRGWRYVSTGACITCAGG